MKWEVSGSIDNVSFGSVVRQRDTLYLYLNTAQHVPLSKNSWTFEAQRYISQAEPVEVLVFDGELTGHSSWLDLIRKMVYNLPLES